MTPQDWARQDARTDEQITAAARKDPDALPVAPEQAAAWRAPVLSKAIRHRLGLTRAAFAAAYGIPLEILRSWERRETEPSPVEMAYLRLIEREPERAKLEPAA